MSLRIHTAAIVTVITLCGAALAQSTKPETAVHKLRNIAAADAANALTAFAEKKKLPVAIVAEPMSNSVVLAGDAAPMRQVAELLATLDKEPIQVLAEIVILEAPAGFTKEIGLGEGAESNWVLTPREARMLTAAIRSGKSRHEVKALSEPKLIIADNKTGVMAIRKTDGDSLTASVTPRIGSDGTVRVMTEVKRISKEMAETEAIKTDGTIKNGGTMVMRGAPIMSDDGQTRETLVIMTINVVFPTSNKRVK